MIIEPIPQYFSFAPDTRHSTFSAIVLDDIYPERLVSLLNELDCSVHVSQLHDDEPIQSHWHLFFEFPAPRNVSSVESFCMLNGAVIVFPVNINLSYFKEVFK